MVIGITGGVGSGKSTVCRYLASKGIPVIDSDTKGHEALDECKEDLCRIFGNDILKDGVIQRNVLAERAFSDKESTEALNKITHPIIIKKIQSDIVKLCAKSDIIALELPLLYECGLNWLCDTVWVVYTNKTDRLNRLEERGMPREDAERRINVQMSLEKKAELADFVIDNSGEDPLPMADIDREISQYRKGINRV